MLLLVILIAAILSIGFYGAVRKTKKLDTLKYLVCSILAAYLIVILCLYKKHEQDLKTFRMAKNALTNCTSVDDCIKAQQYNENLSELKRLHNTYFWRIFVPDTVIYETRIINSYGY